jgi:predicted unusual protein kinase regulating ubiquinone biosynthesis (AarF/ABC1/UbiB family)
MEEREYQRGEELAKLLTTLGPTFIKVGQSLSIRTDLLSPAYARGLATLQDQVAAFDTKLARQILETEWGIHSVESIIYELTPQPIAAASLGQVYKAKLKSTGQEVAIKVQRPNIMNQIALDMYLLRLVAPVLKKLAKLNSDTVGTVDAWGIGFVDELNYLDEAKNAQAFCEFIATTPLKDVVFAPTVIPELSTRRVLVTEWIDGQRLDKSSANDVNVLCSIAMNTYLSMLLEGSGGILHCDPHP